MSWTVKKKKQAASILACRDRALWAWRSPGPTNPIEFPLLQQWQCALQCCRRPGYHLARDAISYTSRRWNTFVSAARNNKTYSKSLSSSIVGDILDIHQVSPKTTDFILIMVFFEPCSSPPLSIEKERESRRPNALTWAVGCCVFSTYG